MLHMGRTRPGSRARRRLSRSLSPSPTRQAALPALSAWPSHDYRAASHHRARSRDRNRGRRTEKSKSRPTRSGRPHAHASGYLPRTSNRDPAARVEPGEDRIPRRSKDRQKSRPRARESTSRRERKSHPRSSRRMTNEQGDNTAPEPAAEHTRGRSRNRELDRRNESDQASEAQRVRARVAEVTREREIARERERLERRIYEDRVERIIRLRQTDPLDDRKSPENPGNSSLDLRSSIEFSHVGPYNEAEARETDKPGRRHHSRRRYRTIPARSASPVSRSDKFLPQPDSLENIDWNGKTSLKIASMQDADQKAENFALVSSPSKLCEALSIPLRVFLCCVGFLIFYYILFLRFRYTEERPVDESSTMEEIDAESARETWPWQAGRRLPPLWHRELARFTDSTPTPSGDAKPRNYALESAKMSEKEAAADKAQKELAKKSKEANSSEKGAKASGTKKGQEKKLVQKSSKSKSAKKSKTSSSSDKKGSLKQNTKRKNAGSVKGKGSKPKATSRQATSSAQASKFDSGQSNSSTPVTDSAHKSSKKSADMRIREHDKNPVSDAKPEQDSPGLKSKKEDERGLEMSGVTAVPKRDQASHFVTEEDPPFKNFPPRRIPKGHIPILSWNYERIEDPRTSDHLFALGGNDHIGTFRPLCIVPKSKKVYTPGTNRVCSGYNRTAAWLRDYCHSVEDAYNKESLLKKLKRVDDTWLREQEAEGNVKWVEGVTVLQVYEKSCGNIAHFSGRALLLQHVLENIRAYVSAPTSVQNVLVVPSFHIMKRFLYPHNYAFWHQTFFNSLISPSVYTIGTLGNFLYRSAKEQDRGLPRVQLLHNFSLAGSGLSDDMSVCFRQAVVPAFFKDRFFADDREYPSGKPSLQSSLPEAPHIPRDSLRMRERISVVLRNTTVIKPAARKIIFLDREGSRRKIVDSKKEQLFTRLSEDAKKRSFEFSVLSFSKMKFDEQVLAVEDAGIALGVHGANLVNTMFMPPLSVLIELFPFKFRHGMYEEGGGAGIKYFSYQMSTGNNFPGRVRYRKAEDCIRLNVKCKIHYRDAELDLEEVDFVQIKKILSEAMDWHESVEKVKENNAVT